MTEISIDLPEVRLRALTWGPDTGPLAVLLHGFPDTAGTWRHLGPALASEGWRVVAPFSRGYAPSDVPADGCYAVAALVSDALGVHRALGGGPDAVVVGHDWGGVTAHALAAAEDCPFADVVVLSVPAMAALRSWRVLGVLPRQLMRSWYAFYNLVPGLPERTFPRLITQLWHEWAPGYDARDDIRAVLDATSDVARRRAVLGYYRAMLRPFGLPGAYRRWRRIETKLPRVPVFSLHGANDGCLDPRLAVLSGRKLPPGSSVRIIRGAGHFPQLEQPADVNRLVLEHLGHRPGRGEDR